MNISEYFDHQSKKQNKEHFKNLIQVAMADDKIAHSESEMLHRFGRKMGFTNPEINELIQSSAKTVFNPPYELHKRFAQVYDIVRMVLADGVIDSKEMRLANAFAMKSGFSESEIPTLLVMLINGIKQGMDEDELFEIYKKESRS